jgi:hypothetical protein
LFASSVILLLPTNKQGEYMNEQTQTPETNYNLVQKDAYVQTNKFHKNTEKYKHITTADLQPVLSSLGYELFQLTQAKVRNPEHFGFQRHVARFRSTESFLNDELKSEIVIVNAHKTGALRVIGGAFRTFCANGIVVGTTLNDYRIRHVGDVQEQINTILPMVAKQTPLMLEAVGSMKAKVLTGSQAVDFAEAVAKARLVSKMEAGDKSILSVDFAKLLEVRRDADKGSDLFSVYNRVQENMFRHGLAYTIVDEEGKQRQSRTRKVRENSMAYVEVNQLIWNAAMAVA